jgi:hypothetical protein
MANYYTHLAFEIKATHVDAERFVQLIISANAIDDGEAILLGPELEPAFRSKGKTAEQTFAEIVADFGFGVECLFDAESGTLAIFDRDGTPNVWALAQCLQRLYPAKLPLGFVYAETCDKSRAGGFGGGYFAIGHDTIVNQSLAEVLEAAIAGLGGTAHER